MERMDNLSLLDAWATEKRYEDGAREKRERIEMLLRQRMEADGATAIPHPSVSCELRSSHGGYDLNALYALKELLPPEVIATGFTPAHEETIRVPDKWNATQVNSWARKYGTAVAEAIARAELPRQIKLVLKRREK